MTTLRVCKRCGFIGFWFRFYRKKFNWASVQNFSICKRCAGDLQYHAVLAADQETPQPSKEPET